MTWGYVALAAGTVISTGIKAYSDSQKDDGGGGGGGGSSANSAALLEMIKGPRRYKLDEKAMKTVVDKLDQMRASGRNITPETYDALYRAELQTAADIALKRQEANADIGLKSYAISESGRQFDAKMKAGADEGSGMLGGQGLGMLAGMLPKVIDKFTGGGSGGGGGGITSVDSVEGLGYSGNTSEVFGAGSGCIIVTACTGSDSEQVNMARRYRDTFMDKDTLRGYYMLSELIVPVLAEHDDYRKSVKNYFVDSMMEYGEYLFEMRPVCSDMAKQDTLEFLGVCREVGMNEPAFTRSNGEVI